MKNHPRKNQVVDKSYFKETAGGEEVYKNRKNRIKEEKKLTPFELEASSEPKPKKRKYDVQNNSEISHKMERISEVSQEQSSNAGKWA